ncbi:MAG: DUF547 domain-containing protein [Desulfomonilaceae bacterium]|nr:DUF547 domain-containing protein [Desulfomonilaceae bacterium]
MKDRHNRGTGLWYGTMLVALMASIALESPQVAAENTDFPYIVYGTVLQTYVDDEGMVNYRGLKENRKPLDEFTESMSRLDPKAYDAWADTDKIAFWINAYNALTLKAIIDHYPIKASFFKSFVYPANSIRQIPGVWDKITFSVMGRDVTLDGIEHEILRSEFNEPRIHVALVCAAMGCPPLRKEPYVGPQLDAQLDDQSAKFVKDPDKFRIDRTDNKVYLSSIFDWFGEDFVKTYGVTKDFSGFSEKQKAVLNFLSRYVEPAEKAYLVEGSFSIEYLKYDWSLNEKR